MTATIQPEQTNVRAQKITYDRGSTATASGSDRLGRNVTNCNAWFNHRLTEIHVDAIELILMEREKDRKSVSKKWDDKL